MIKHADEKTFKTEVLEKENVVLVDFFATWCAPCKKLGEELEKLENSRADIDIVKVNIDDSTNLAMQYDVMYVPTLVVFKNGEAIESVTGYREADEVVSLVEKYR